MVGIGRIANSSAHIVWAFLKVARRRRHKRFAGARSPNHPTDAARCPRWWATAKAFEGYRLVENRRSVMVERQHIGIEVAKVTRPSIRAGCPPPCASGTGLGNSTNKVCPARTSLLLEDQRTKRLSRARRLIEGIHSRTSSARTFLSVTVRKCGQAAAVADMTSVA
jgi:hypothetical protein